MYSQLIYIQKYQLQGPIIDLNMNSPLFQQFVSLIQQAADPESHDQEYVSYDVLVDVLFATVQSQLKYFANRFDQVMNMFYQLLQNHQAQGTNLTVCSNLFEIFVVMLQRRSTLIKNNPNRLLSLIQKLFEMFNMLDFQCEQAWMRPCEGYTQEQDFSEQATLTKQIMSYFDRIAMAYSYPKFIQFFNNLLPVWLNSSQNDWKSNYTLFMVISQLGEDIQFPLMIKNYIDCGVSKINHPHPKVRYAILQMFGQLADDMKPDFQQIYGQQLLPIVLGCTKDPVPRVQGHVMACLTNFLEDFEISIFNILQPYVQQIITTAQEFSYNGISIVKQNTMSALASLSSVDLLTKSQVQKILSIINQILTSQQHQSFQYNQLINQTVECLSMVLYGQAKDKVQKYLNQSVAIMKSLKQKVSQTYFINAWSRLCLKYQNFTQLNDVFPYILASVTKMIQNYQSELQSSIGAVDNTINSFKTNIRPYASDIVNFCKNGIIKLEADSKLKSQLYVIFNDLIVALKNQAPDPQWQQMAKSIFTFMYQQVQKILNQNEPQHQYASLQYAMKGLKGIIQHLPSLFNLKQTVQLFSQNILNFASKINEVIGQIKADIYSYKVQLQNVQDQMDKEQMAQPIAYEEQKLRVMYAARLVIPDIFDAIFKVSETETKKTIAQALYSHVSNYLQNNLTPEDIRYGLYFLCNFLDGLKYQGVEKHANVYEEKFCEFSSSPDIEVRNSAVYGLGVFMKLIPAEKTNEAMIYKWLNYLWNSLSLSWEEVVKKKQFNFARDNIVSALGKLIYSKRNYYPTALNQQVHKKWFQNLPLNNDKIQGNQQHQILLLLLEQCPQMFIQTKEDIFQLLTTFAKYFSKRMSKNQAIVLKNKKQTQQYLLKMQGWPIFQQNLDFLWNNLPANHKNVLTQLMNAQ